MHDIIIRGGVLIDGTGAPGVRRDVAVDGTKIGGVYKEGEGEAAMTIDVDGMVVCPGFVDIHTHSDLSLLAVPLAESKVRQGVTTELVGNCGGSAAPLVGQARDAIKEAAQQACVEANWTTVEEYLLRFADIKTSVNVGTLVGAETLRVATVGYGDSSASEEQLRQMNGLLAQAMLEGAFGVSSGLIYAPGCYATTEELISLASTAASLGGFYATHLRNEGHGLVGAVGEAIRIGEESRCRVQISHHKACGKRNWGLVKTTLKMIDEARTRGVDVAVDVYPYTASSTYLEAILPPWAREGGTESTIARLKDAETQARIRAEFKDPNTPWENTVFEDGWDDIVLCGFSETRNKHLENRSVADIARELGKEPDEAALDILIDERLRVGAVFHEMSDDDVVTVIRHPVSCIASDGESEAPYGPTGSAPTHPRSYGTFPRAIRRYALNLKAVPLEEMIRKMTSMPAARMGLRERGRIANGMAADIVVFDPERIRDNATFADSHLYAEGIVHVLVNGSLTVSAGEHTKERAGQVLRHVPSVS